MADYLADLVLAAGHIREIEAEVKDLREVKQWALGQLPFKDGDNVVIKDPYPTIDGASGWYHYREVLVSGSTGVAKEIQYSEYHKNWVCLFTPDVQWRVNDFPNPRTVHLVNKDSQSCFYFKISSLRKREESDKELELPTENIYESRF